MTLEEVEKGEQKVGPTSSENEKGDGGGEAAPPSTGRYMFNKFVWHGGSVADAWLNAASAQVGSLILTLPYTFSQMGYFAGVGTQILYGAFGCWTVYLLSLFHAEASRRTCEAGTLHKKHVLQYHEVITIVVGKTLGKIVLVFNMVALTFACVLQIIACSSHVYYMNSNWDKRTWTILFGALAIPTVFLPSIHNFRIVSILGIATTTITSLYMTLAAVKHGQIKNVEHRGPTNLLDFFTGATNILFSFGSHGLCIELMEAMWKPQQYKWAYAAAVLYTYLLTVPDSVSVYWAYGDILLHRSNAFGVLPHSTFKNVCIIAMILHQIEGSGGKWRYLISLFVGTWVLIFGFGFGGWASATTFFRQIKNFGFFMKCYQCPPKNRLDEDL